MSSSEYQSSCPLMFKFVIKHLGIASRHIPDINFKHGICNMPIQLKQIYYPKILLI